MAYIGPPPSQKLATPTSQYFSGNGSTTTFTLNRPVNVSEDLNVYVNNVAQQPGSGKSYTATGTTLTFDAAPSSGTNNVYVVYRGLAEPTTRLEHDANQALAATTGTFSGAISGTTGTFSGAISGTTGTFTGGELQVSSATSDATDKRAFFVTGHYTNSEEDASGVILQSVSGDNLVDIGGGQSAYNAATKVRFYTAANATTTTGTEKMRVTNTGVGIGVTSIDKAFIAYENSGGGGYCFEFINDGNNANRYGGIVQCGTDDASGTNYLFVFRDGDGNSQGYITFSGGTVTYGAFTAHHPCILPYADNDAGYPYGTLLETTGISYTQKNGADTERGILYNVQKTQGANSRAVLGAYGGSMVDGPDEETNMHQALVLGDGHILCNNAGGNIAVGDGICSSATAGIGQKATANPSMIVGIAQEAVTFSSGSETKLVAVQYGLQQFIPWS